VEDLDKKWYNVEVPWFGKKGLSIGVAGFPSDEHEQNLPIRSKENIKLLVFHIRNAKEPAARQVYLTERARISGLDPKIIVLYEDDGQKKQYNQAALSYYAGTDQSQDGYENGKHQFGLINDTSNNRGINMANPGTMRS